MRSILCLYFFLFSFTLVNSQDLILSPIGETLCSPGVTNKAPGKGMFLEYGINPDGRLRPEDATSVAEPSKVGLNPRYMFKVKVPLLIKEKIKVLLGWNIYGEQYNFDYIGLDNASIFNTINDKNLKSSRISLYMIRPINHKYYFAMKAVASYNGDYKGLFNFEKRYTSYDVATIFGVKKKTNVEWGVGLLFRKNFRNSFPVLPFGIYNHTFNSKWGVEATIPTSVMGRYNFNDKNLILFGPQYESRSYSIDVVDRMTEDLSPYRMRRSELRLTVRYDYNIKSWIWLEASTGYVRNFTTRFEIDENGVSSDPVRVTPSNGAFFKFGIFLAPPRGHKYSR